MASNESRLQFLEENHTEVERIDYIEITLDECKQLPFWCNRLVGDGKCCISHLAGMPEHPDTLQQMKFTPYQLEFIDIIDTSDNNKFHVNKPRQSGFSEIVLRIFQDRGFKKYSTKSCKYVVGTREKTTKKMIRRLKQLYKRIPDVVENNSDSLYLELKDGTSFEGLPANPEAITGDTKIAAIAMDESAKWNQIDDQEVLDAYIPIVRTNHSDLFMFSTPKGPRGFFHDIEMNSSDYEKFKYDVWATEGNLYSNQDILKMLSDPTMDTDQEYLNAYTAGRNSVFGVIDDEDIEPGELWE